MTPQKNPIAENSDDINTQYTDEEIKGFYRQAGKIAASAIDYGTGRIKEGIMVKDVLDQVEEFIHSNGGELAFPAQCSLNSVAAHFCPGLDDKTMFNSGDVAKLDLGVHVHGFIADTASSVAIGDDFPGHENHLKLIAASRAALNEALTLAKPGNRIAEIGRAIETTIRSHGFEPIRNLSGHGLAQYQVHAIPTIPNFDNHENAVLEEGWAIAIEPFATTGAGWVFSQSQAEIFSQVQERPVRSPYAKEALRTIAPRRGLPFSLRSVSQKLGIGKAKFGISELMRSGLLEEHPPLVEKSGGIVAQSEHSVLVYDKPIVFTRAEDD